MYYYDTNKYINSMLVSSPSNLTLLKPTPAPLTSSTQCGEQTRMHNLLMEGQEESSLLFANNAHHIKSGHQHGLRLEDKPKHADPLTGSTWL
jgi:hypothetical protein